MIISIGLFDNMVLQRGRGDVCDAEIIGTTKSNGIVVARVTCASGRVLSGFANKRIGKSKDGKFSARLKGLPVGGPYNITLSVNSDKVNVENILVGDVWILGGQSNMDGIALANPPIEPNEMVRAFYPDDHWEIAIDPIHALHLAVDSVHATIPGSNKRDFRVRGPGVSFGNAMYAETGIPQGLLACAHGGTDMNQWSPGLKRLNGKSLYGATMRRFQKNGSKVAGILWYQGCSDANSENADKYTARMKKLVSSFRRDMNNPGLPFVMVQIATVVQIEKKKPEFWNSVREQQRLLSDMIDHCFVVPAIDLSRDDPIHISGEGQIILGNRLANAMLALTKMVKGHKRPIAFNGFRIFIDKHWRGWNIEISFRNVVGELTSLGKASGFVVTDYDDEIINGIYKVEPKGKKVILYTSIPLVNLQQCQLYLYYGFGFNPYCNITDSAGRSLPAFGPIRLFESKAVSKFAMEFIISKFLPFSGSFDELSYPDFSDVSLEWEKRNFTGVWFAERHIELDKIAPENVYSYYAVDMVCDKNMTGELLIGYDGPVKVWVDGTVIFQDVTGINPGMPDKSKAKVSLKANWKYRVVIAFVSKECKAWGISLRCNRNDISKDKLINGKQSYSVPDFSAPDKLF